MAGTFKISKSLFVFFIILFLNQMIFQTSFANERSQGGFFIPNGGQWDDAVSHAIKGSGHTLFFTSEGLTLVSTETVGEKKDKEKSILKFDEDQGDDVELKTHVLKQKFINANSKVEIKADQELPGKVNFMIGDEKNWAIGLSTYQKLVYQDVYPGVDVQYQSLGSAKLKSDYIVKPGSDPRVIKIQYEGEGVSDLSVSKAGELIIHTDKGELIESKPYVYQEINGRKVEIESRYEIGKNNTYGFSVGEYDKSHELVIDPVLVYSTYLSGSGTDRGYGISTNSNGEAYVTGVTTSLDYPTSTNSYQQTLDASGDVFVTKLDATGSNVEFSTFFGGNGNDVGYSIDIDDLGGIYIAGDTKSRNIPFTSNFNQLISCNYSNSSYTLGHANAYVVKFNSDASSLEYAACFGAQETDRATAVVVNDYGEAHVTGYTGEALTDFPTTSGSFQEVHSGMLDAFVSKLSADGSSLIYSTLLGGTHADSGRDITIDNLGNTYVVGNTTSSDFPVSVSSLQSVNNGGGSDLFITKLNSDGSVLEYSTFLGGAEHDIAAAIQIDSFNRIVVAGSTESSGFPTTSGAYQTQLNQGAFSITYADGFVTKLSSDGTTIESSTYIGGGLNDWLKGMRIASDDSVYISGFSSEIYFNTSVIPPFPTSSTAIQGSHAGYLDAFVTKLDADLTTLEYSTYIGGSDHEECWGLDVDSSGNAYAVGSTNSHDFPTSLNAYQVSSNRPQFSTQDDVFVFKINDQDVCEDLDGDGFTNCDNDCDDNDPNIYPGASEICDGLDNDCDGQVDEGIGSTWYLDSDGDGFGDASSTQLNCTQPIGYVADSTDCDDNNATVYPGATELCDGIDNNCNGQIDENAGTLWYADSDGDGFGDLNSTQTACSQPVGYVSDSTDCDDGDSAIFPGATEVCDGLDNNCNGLVDENAGTLWYLDSDGDGYGDASQTQTACSQPVGYVANDTDCDDSEFTTNPGAAEICGDNIDNNCNGLIDENCQGPGLTCNGVDDDGDGVADDYDEDPNCYLMKARCFKSDPNYDCKFLVSSQFLEIDFMAVVNVSTSPTQTAEVEFELWDQSMTNMIGVLPHTGPNPYNVVLGGPINRFELKFNPATVPGFYNIVMRLKEQPNSNGAVELVPPLVKTLYLGP